MAKTLILDSHTGSRIPFLRGILTHSLQNSGMEFDSAYALASIVRDKIEGSSEIASLDLRDLVTNLLRDRGESNIIERYSDRSIPFEQISVVNSNGHRAPFSKSAHQRSLESSGLAPEKARTIIEIFIDETLRSNQSNFKDYQLDYQHALFQIELQLPNHQQSL